MRARATVSVALVALVGCTLLTEIPDDLTSGTADVGAPSETKDGSAPGAADAAGSIDATNEDVTEAADSGSSGSTAPVVALDAVGPSMAGTGGTDKTSPLVWSHTTSGTNRALFVTVSIGHPKDETINITEVKYEGAKLTQVAIQHANNQSAGYTTLWALAGPAEGAHPVSVAFTGIPDVITAGSISFTGVDPTTPYQNLTKVGGDGSNVKLSVVSSGRHMVVAALVAACTVTETGPKQTGWLKNVTCANGGGNGAQAAAPGAETVDLSYSIDSDWWGIIGVDVKAAP